VPANRRIIFAMLKAAVNQNLESIRGDGAAGTTQGSLFSSAQIHEELGRILASKHFRASRRSKQFLQYVVNQEIIGNGELLKERLIGIQIFGRKPDYAAGEDPIVRVQAGDVRHRLDRYHADPECRSDILIEMPLGSYAPIFRLREEFEVEDEFPKDISRPYRVEPLQEGHAESADSPGSELKPLSETTRPPITQFRREMSDGRGRVRSEAVDFQQDEGGKSLTASPRRAFQSLRFAASLLASVVLLLCFIALYVHKRPDPILQAFWSPATASPKPVLLWLPNPMVYRPSDKLFDRYGSAHPNSLVTRESRQDKYLPLNPSETLQWGDLIAVHDSGPGMGGVIAAINMAKVLTERGIHFEIRFGAEATYAEMRDSPAVIIGAINTEWATQLTAEANFVFDESLQDPNIHETKGGGRVWKTEVINGHKTRDYGLITRQVSGKTGQFLVEVAGISHFGTEAASELFLNDAELAKILHSESVGQQRRNLQILVSTDITNERAGPPHVVAVSSW
jgi:hypothetical protein